MSDDVDYYNFFLNFLLEIWNMVLALKECARILNLKAEYRYNTAQPELNACQT